MMSKRKEEAIMEIEGCGMLLSRAYKRRRLQQRKTHGAHTESKQTLAEETPASSELLRRTPCLVVVVVPPPPLVISLHSEGNRVVPKELR
jgi:hypothetical protein